MSNYRRPKKTQNGNRIWEVICANWTQNVNDPFEDDWWTGSTRTYAEVMRAEKSSELRNFVTTKMETTGIIPTNRKDEKKRNTHARCGTGKGANSTERMVPVPDAVEATRFADKVNRKRRHGTKNIVIKSLSRVPEQWKLGQPEPAITTTWNWHFTNAVICKYSKTSL